MAFRQTDSPTNKYISRVGDKIQTETAIIGGKAWTLSSFIKSQSQPYKRAAKSLWIYRHWKTPLGKKICDDIQEEIKEAKRIKRKSMKMKNKMMR